MLNAGVYGCYPATSVYSSGYYCPSGNTITSNCGTYVCYPSSGVVYSAGYYCATGQTVNGAYCYPGTDSHSGTNYCRLRANNQCLRYGLLPEHQHLQ